MCTASCAAALDDAFDQIAAIQRARPRRRADRPPAVADDRPAHAEGVDRAREVDGVKVEGTWRSHQVPLYRNAVQCRSHLGALARGCASYRPEELFEDTGALRPDLQALAPVGERRMSANPHANGGLLLRDLDLPRSPITPSTCRNPAASTGEATQGARHLPARW